MMKKYGFVGLNSAVSFDIQKQSSRRSGLSSPVSSSLNNVASAARLSDQRPRTHTYGEQRLNTQADACSKRTFSVSQSRNVDWSEIPPIIPPREPVRSTRVSPPLRSSSTPSPTNSSPTSNVTCSFADSNRKYQSSTTAVFSAIPSTMSGSSPVIIPIMKDGVQESHTHYFLLGDDKVNINSFHLLF